MVPGAVCWSCADPRQPCGRVLPLLDTGIEDVRPFCWAAVGPLLVRCWSAVGPLVLKDMTGR